MNHDRQIGSASHLHLADKNLSLYLTRGMIVVVVETDLSPGEHLGVFRQGGELLKIPFADQFGFMGMDSDSGIHPIMLIG